MKFAAPCVNSNLQTDDLFVFWNIMSKVQIGKLRFLSSTTGAIFKYRLVFVLLVEP